MAGETLQIEGLPDAPLDAAAQFHARYLVQARAALSSAEALTLLFSPAGHEHRAWRLAAVQELAREAAPKRVNAVVGSAGEGIAEALAYLDTAPGITGQVLAVE